MLKKIIRKFFVKVKSLSSAKLQCTQCSISARTIIHVGTQHSKFCENNLSESLINFWFCFCWGHKVIWGAKQINLTTDLKICIVTEHKETIRPDAHLNEWKLHLHNWIFLKKGKHWQKYLFWQKAFYKNCSDCATAIKGKLNI